MVNTKAFPIIDERKSYPMTVYCERTKKEVKIRAVCFGCPDFLKYDKNSVFCRKNRGVGKV